MKKDGKFRFSVQFAAQTDEQLRVGNFLESLNNKKGSFLVTVISEYLNTHPEIEAFDGKIQVKAEKTYSRQELKRIVRSILDENSERVGRSQGQPMPSPTINDASENTDDDIEKMLDSLDLFV